MHEFEHRWDLAGWAPIGANGTRLVGGSNQGRAGQRSCPGDGATGGWWAGLIPNPFGWPASVGVIATDNSGHPGILVTDFFYIYSCYI